MREARELPPEEWSRLAGTEFDQVWGSLDPAWTKVLVVEHEGAIVACWSLMNVWHLEGLWIHPDHRRQASVGRRLWVGMMRLMASVGASAALTAAIDPDVEGMLDRVARPLPGRFYVVSRKDPVCQQPSSLH